MSIGRVLGTAFGVLFGNLWVILGISFLFCGVPQGLINYLQQYAQTLVRDGSATPGMVVALFVSGVLINALCAIVAQGALVRATIGWSRGERVGFGDALVTALRRALPLIGLGIVSGLAFAAFHSGMGWRSIGGHIAERIELLRLLRIHRAGAHRRRTGARAEVIQVFGEGAGHGWAIAGQVVYLLGIGGLIVQLLSRSLNKQVFPLAQRA